MNIVRFVILVLSLAVTTGVARQAADKQQPQKEKEHTKVKDVKYSAIVETSLGSFEMELYANDAPKTVENFVKLTEKKYFDGMRVHRIAKGFVIQTGDDKSKDPAKAAEWGTGGQSAWGMEFADELDKNTESYKAGYKHGVVAMANRGPNTNTSQFFICLKDVSLPHSYTIFGKVTKGLDVVDKIGAVEIVPGQMGPTDGRPKTDVLVKKISLKKLCWRGERSVSRCHSPRLLSMAKSPPSFSPQEIIARIKSGRFDPLYLMYGDEDFLLEEAAAALMTNAVEEAARSFNLDILYGAETTADRLLALVSSYPMMSERRVVIVREFDRVPNKDQLLTYTRKPLSSTILALFVVKPDFRTKFYQEVRSHATLCECRLLYEDKIPAWISQRVREMGKRIAPDAAVLLQQYIGRSLREIQNELEKLFIYVGPAPSITLEDVQRLVGISRQYNIFELQKALGQKQLPRSIEILETMLRNGESAIAVIVMLTKYLQKLWLLHDPAVIALGDAQLPSILGTYPSFLPEIKAAARNFSISDFERCFSALCRTDEILKSSGMNEKTALTMLIFALCGHTEAAELK
jgi:DNA polymerase-3 subunit delta